MTGRVLIASPHCYPDLARQWHRTVVRELVPAFAARGLAVEVLLFRDDNVERFEPEHFPGAILSRPGEDGRDFLELNDAALARDCDYLFVIDADVFFLDGEWMASYLEAFEDPQTASICYLDRDGTPGSIYAVLCRADHYRELEAPVFAPRYVDAERWPDAIHIEPGEWAAAELERRGRRRVVVDAEASHGRLVDFHGTTNLRLSRQRWGDRVGAAAFERLIGGRTYFLRAAYDNLMLAAHYEAVYSGPYATDESGRHLAGSVTPAALRRLLGQIEGIEARAELAACFERSRFAAARLAAWDGVELTLPSVVPREWAVEVGSER